MVNAAERETFRADLTLAFQESEVVKFACHDDDWTCPNDDEVTRMVETVLAVLDEHGLDVVEVPGASRREREEAAADVAYRVTDAAGQLVEAGAPVRYRNGVEGAFGRVITPDCVEVDGIAWSAHEFGLTITSTGPDGLTMADVRRGYDG